MRDPNERIIQAATDLARAAIEIRALMRSRGGYCEVADRDEPEVGYRGVPECRYNTEKREDWCEPCQKNGRIYVEVKRLRRRQTLAKARLLRAVEGTTK